MKGSGYPRTTIRTGKDCGRVHSKKELNRRPLKTANTNPIPFNRTTIVIPLNAYKKDKVTSTAT